MPTGYITFVAVISTAALVGVWFRVVQGELTRGRNMVGSAKKQVEASRKRTAETEGVDRSVAKAVLIRSEEEWRQRVKEYNEALKKPWNYIPGSVMGFRKIREIKEKGKAQREKKAI